MRKGTDKDRAETRSNETDRVNIGAFSKKCSKPTPRKNQTPKKRKTSKRGENHQRGEKELTRRSLGSKSRKDERANDLEKEERAIPEKSGHKQSYVKEENSMHGEKTQRRRGE